MMKSPSNMGSQASPGRRTVLLTLSYDIDARKRGIFEIARRAGWSVEDLVYYNRRIPKDCRPDGVLFDLTADQAPLVRQFLRLGVPVVQIEDLVPTSRCHRVVADRRAIGRAAAEHFAERGFQNLAYLHAEEYEHSPYRMIGQSFIERARELSTRTKLIAVQRPGRHVPWSRMQTLAQRLRRELSDLRLPLGIFTYHDVMALRICRFCKALGLSVPEQVAVLGIGNDPYRCDFAPTPLSSVDPNFLAQGRAAAGLLERLMDGQDTPAEPVLIRPAGIVTRQSTDVLALPDVDTARALRYMWTHLAEPLSVRKVAEAVTVSRRKLERHFQDHLGRTVNEELNRKRIERGCELLRGTDLPVGEIARQVGFSGIAYFCVVFRKQMDTTPKQYRLSQITKQPEAEDAETPG